MRDGPAVVQNDRDHLFLRIEIRFAYRLLDIEPFRDTDADPSFFITHDHRRAKTEPFAAGDHARDAPHVEYAFLEFILPSCRPFVPS